jgi:hypothetical protein
VNHLIKTRKEYYVRRQWERTLKEGNRVAILGRGIAVVERAGDKEIEVMLWNRLVLKIARKDIVLNQQNMRWECEALSEEYIHARRSIRQSFYMQRAKPRNAVSRAARICNLPDEDCVDLALVRICHQPIQFRAGFPTAGDSLINVFTEDCPSTAGSVSTEPSEHLLGAVGKKYNPQHQSICALEKQGCLPFR